MNKSVINAKDKPDLSIIVSMYNEEDSLGLFFKTINKTLNKLKKYTYEIICIDDASSDDSCQILEMYASKDSRIKVFKNYNITIIEFFYSFLNLFFHYFC